VGATIRLATPSDRARIVETLVAAFVADPVLRYQFPQDERWVEGASMFFGALFDKRVLRDAVWVAEGGLAAALWDPAGSTGSSDLSGLQPDELARVEEYDHAVHAALPAGSFWYLGVLGTHPSATGQGLGRAVMRPGIERAAADGLPCVLETSNPANLDFYGRDGWLPTGSIERPVQTWVLRRDA
jgi:GNAT superfamily N-acetyltransferase